MPVLTHCLGHLHAVSEATWCVRSADASSMVTAWDSVNLPSYNAQCGQCVHIQNLQGSGDAYVTVIDYKGSGGKITSQSDLSMHMPLVTSWILQNYARVEQNVAMFRLTFSPIALSPELGAQVPVVANRVAVLLYNCMFLC